MPNGGNHTKKEWRGVETFFEKLSQTLNQFATRFNLVIDKYYHNAAHWTFRFAHPLGGDGHIQVMKAGTESVWLALGWYKDDYDSFTRSVKYETWKDIPLNPIQLFGSLEKALKTILSWKLGEWTEVVGGYEYPWGQHSKQEWERMHPKYPIPRIEESY
jgi:hypothetical protein